MTTRVDIEWGPKNVNKRYRVEGATLEDAFRFMDSRPDEEWGKFDGHIGHRWRGDAQGRVQHVTVQPSFTITMPTWPRYTEQPQSCKNIWDSMWRALWKHEVEHRHIFERGIAALSRDLEGKSSLTETALNAFIEEKKQVIENARRAFDKTTEHGTRDVEHEVPPLCQSKRE